jgi:hypothetical protein
MIEGFLPREELVDVLMSVANEAEAKADLLKDARHD